MKRGMIYCAHLHGVGHLKRMLTLAEGLVKEYKITFIQAGRDERITFFHPNFRHYGIPLLENEFRLILDGTRSQVEQFMKRRRKQLFSLIDFYSPYDFLITEQIPFSKTGFLYEVYSLMNAMKIANPHLAMISSQKGGTFFQQEGNIGEGKTEKNLDIEMFQKAVLQELKTNYDKVLVHCDPQITTLDDMFPYCDQIRDEIEHTGYIFPHSTDPSVDGDRKRDILITTGSGEKGFPLLMTLLEIVPRISDYRFTFITSSMMMPSLVNLLHAHAEIHENMEVVDFLSNFNERLKRCSLAITLAGSTLLNLYATGTPAIICPHTADLGQCMLGKSFARHGIVNLIQEKELSAEKLHNLILETLHNPPKSDIVLNLSGVENSINAIKQLVRDKRSKG